MTENEVRKTMEIDAPPQVVFDALTKAEELTQWFPNQAILEPKVGGKMHFTFLAASSQKMDRDHVLEGKIMQYIPNKKLVYTWNPDDTYRPDGISPPTTTVTWDLEEIGKNKTRVTLTHSGFTKEMEKMFKETTAGWGYFVSRLVKYCEKKSV